MSNFDVFRLSSECCLPAQYAATQLEALTTLLHYCLLDSSPQQLLSLQPLGSSVTAMQQASAINHFETQQ